jgi:hypothetical protein
VDDNLAMHRKVLAAGNAAMGMWVRAGSWSMANLTDGQVPREMVALLGSKGLADKLVAAGLWVEMTDGYLFHEWGQRQPTKAAVESERKKAAERKQRWRDGKNGDGTP